MRKQICSLNTISHDSISIVVYEIDTGVIVRAINVETKKKFGAIIFNSVDDARCWFSDFNGDEAQRICAAIDELAESVTEISTWITSKGSLVMQPEWI